MFASDSPVLSIPRSVKEASALDLPPEVLDNYLYQNAQDFFFSQLTRTDHRSDQVTVETSEHDPRVHSSVIPRRTSPGSRSTTRSDATPTTRRCVARCARTSTSSPPTTTSRW